MPPLRDPLVLVLAGIALALGAGTCGIAETSGEPAEELAISSLGLQLGLTALALAGAAFSTLRATERLGWVKSRISARQVGILALGTLALSHGLDGFLQVTDLRNESVIADLDAELAGARGRVLAVSLLGVGLAPGIGEELFCRGWVQRGLVARLGPALGIVIASLFFGALHADPIHAGAAAVLGLYLGIIAWLTGSVRTSIGCHVVNNLAAVTLTAFGLQVSVESGAAIAVGFGLAAVSLAWVWRRIGSPAAPALQRPDDAGPEDFAPDCKSSSRPTASGRIGRP